MKKVPVKEVAKGKPVPVQKCGGKAKKGKK